MLLRCGDDLFSVPVESPAEAQALAAQLREEGGWLEVFPGIASVVIRFDAAAMDGSDAQAKIEAVLAAGVRAFERSDDLFEIPVVYGGDFGPDVDELCERLGLSAGELVDLHTRGEYRVDMLGFTPGFAFVGGLDEALRVPRRKEPRQRVPAGSVGIADGRTGIYAMASPGGWSLIGRTPRRLFDPDADEPFVLKPGMRVRFRAIRADEFKV